MSGISHERSRQGSTPQRKRVSSEVPGQQATLGRPPLCADSEIFSSRQCAPHLELLHFTEMYHMPTSMDI